MVAPKAGQAPGAGAAVRATGLGVERAWGHLGGDSWGVTSVTFSFVTSCPVYLARGPASIIRQA